MRGIVFYLALTTHLSRAVMEERDAEGVNDGGPVGRQSLDGRGAPWDCSSFEASRTPPVGGPWMTVSQARAPPRLSEATLCP